MAQYTASAQALNLTDAVEIADRIEAELQSRGCALLEVTRVQVFEGQVWFRVLVGWDAMRDNGTTLDRLARVTEDGDVCLEVPIMDIRGREHIMNVTTAQVFGD